MDDIKRLGSTFKSLRTKLLRLKQDEVAEILGVSRQTISNFETGRTKFLNHELAEKYFKMIKEAYVKLSPYHYYDLIDENFNIDSLKGVFEMPEPSISEKRKESKPLIILPAKEDQAFDIVILSSEDDESLVIETSLFPFLIAANFKMLREALGVTVKQLADGIEEHVETIKKFEQGDEDYVLIGRCLRIYKFFENIPGVKIIAPFQEFIKRGFKETIRRQAKL